MPVRSIHLHTTTTLHWFDNNFLPSTHSLSVLFKSKLLISVIEWQSNLKNSFHRIISINAIIHHSTQCNLSSVNVTVRSWPSLYTLTPTQSNNPFKRWINIVYRNLSRSSGCSFLLLSPAYSCRPHAYTPNDDAKPRQLQLWVYEFDLLAAAQETPLSDIPDPVNQAQCIRWCYCLQSWCIPYATHEHDLLCDRSPASHRIASRQLLHKPLNRNRVDNTRHKLCQ